MSNLVPVSIIIPSYNHSGFISQAIESVLAQDFEDYELLIADDHSTDNSPEIIKSYQDKRIKSFLFSENIGAVHTLNFLIKQAKGKYIALLNSDDFWHPQKLYKQYSYMEKNPTIGACFTWTDMVTEDNKKLTVKDLPYAEIFNQKNRTQGEWLATFFYSSNRLSHPSILIRKSVYETIGDYNCALRQFPDFDMWIRMVKKFPIHIIDEPLVSHRRHSSAHDHTSGATSTNTIRLKNEAKYLYSNFFEDMDDSIFIEGFKEKLRKSGPLSHEEVLCEQAFIFLSGTPCAPCETTALNMLNKLLNQKKTRQTLLASYQFTENDYFNLTGTINDYQDKIDQLNFTINAIYSSNSWRICAPLRYISNTLRNNIPIYTKEVMLFKVFKNNVNKVLTSLRTRGTIPTLQLIIKRIIKKPSFPQPNLTPSNDLTTSSISPEQIVKTNLQYAPIIFFSTHGNKIARKSLVIDSIEYEHLYDDIVTAIIFSILLCESKGMRLRIITRGKPPNHEGFNHLLSLYKIKPSYDVEFVYAPHNLPYDEIDILKDEKIITTSWQTTMATMATVSPSSIIYLLQRDERIHYPPSDMLLLCEQILKNQAITFVIHKKLLFDYFVADGFTHLSNNGHFFEPAFPREVFFPHKNLQKSKNKLVFYATPNIPNTLFYFGIELVEEAVRNGLIDLASWDIICLGKDIPELSFFCGYQPIRYEYLSIEEYKNLLDEIDLSLSLSFDACSSFVPLEVAAKGAVAVTNFYKNKQNLNIYSNNIICGNLDKEDMMNALNEGVKLSQNDFLRIKNFENSLQLKSWETSFNSIFKIL